MVLADHILNFYKKLSIPDVTSYQVDTLTPWQDRAVMELMDTFFRKYYSDQNGRVMLVGINPGRFGGGMTGIPFTDPVNLEEYCNIQNDIPKRHELSSRFIYDMISSFGGPEKFYSQYYFYSVSPVGFIQHGKNFNYYDDQQLKEYLEPFIVQNIQKHLQMGMSSEVVYSLGQGKNIKVLIELNEKYKFFKEIIPLPHPRWVMQYRLKRKDEFINQYLGFLK